MWALLIGNLDFLSQRNIQSKIKTCKTIFSRCKSRRCSIFFRLPQTEHLTGKFYFYKRFIIQLNILFGKNKMYNYSKK